MPATIWRILNVKLMQPPETESVVNLLELLWEKFIKSCQVNLFLAGSSHSKPQPPAARLLGETVYSCVTGRYWEGVGGRGMKQHNNKTKNKILLYVSSGISDLTLGHWDEGRSCVWGPFVPIGRGSSLERSWRLVGPQLWSWKELDWLNRYFYPYFHAV